MRDKASLRGAAQHRRALLPASARAAAGRQLVERAVALVTGASSVAAYVAIGTEPSLTGLLELRPDVLLPVLRPDGDLDWAVGPRLARGRCGLLEPTGRRLGVDAVTGCDVVFLPALAVDRAGTRLGRGGGSYDRSLARATGLTVAVLYDGETTELLPAEPHDVAVRAVLTPGLGVRRVPW